jgi:hypothetical protein
VAEPPRAHDPRRQKNKRNPTGPTGRRERQSDLKLAESQPGQRERERERERRVSDADASYYGPSGGASTLEHVIPK